MVDNVWSGGAIKIDSKKVLVVMKMSRLVGNLEVVCRWLMMYNYGGGWRGGTVGK